MKRYQLLDSIRGITLINMILYHGIWDLVYLFGINWDWYHSQIGYVWQQSICWTFILLSGFCWPLGKKHVKRGFQVFGFGMMITIITVLFMPGESVIFGILTLIGSCMLLMCILEKVVNRIKPILGIVGAVFLFLLTRNINEGYLGFEQWNLMKLPESLYDNMLSTYLGFPKPDFYSTDYFSIFPWIFLFLTGYFINCLFAEQKLFVLLEKEKSGVVSKIGIHSLEIYMIHQPILYAGFQLVFACI